jgi:hypothetical protein
MSIDIYLAINTGKEMTAVVTVGNMTNNLQPMWRKALESGSGVTMSLCDFDGWNAGEAAILLEKAHDHLQKNPEEYKPLNPPNGWGNYVAAVEYMSKFLAACEQHPLCTIRALC